MAAQSLVVTLLAVQGATSGPVGLGLLAVAVAGALVVVVPLRRLHRVRHVVDETFAIGLGMGVVAAGHLLVRLASFRPPTELLVLIVAVAATTHACAAAAALRQRTLPRSLAWLLVLTVVAVGPAQALTSAGLGGTSLEAVVVVAQAAVGAAWLAVACDVLQRALEEDRRRIESLERVIVDSTRDQRERLHELRSTVAGLVTGSALLDRDDLTSEDRDRLWGSVRRELDRLDRLLAGRETPSTELDLDEALGMILDLQRLKGRHVELRSTGDVVNARFDALAEVVNVLIDNAAVHGGADSSVVEVVRRDEDNVDIRVTDFGTGIPADQRATIFDWGRRGSRSPGEGIGLNVAQRLMNEDGGSLRLDDERDVGSSFVITLPAARRSPENGVTYEDRHECRITG